MWFIDLLMIKDIVWDFDNLLRLNWGNKDLFFFEFIWLFVYKFIVNWIYIYMVEKFYFRENIYLKEVNWNDEVKREFVW